MGVYKEYVLSTNSFKKPKVLTGKTAIATLLVRIILLEPGTDPLQPEMGVGLVSKYRFLNGPLEVDLKNDIKSQVSKYLPQLECADVDISYTDDKRAVIKITIDDTIYTFDTSQLEVPITLDKLTNI